MIIIMLFLLTDSRQKLKLEKIHGKDSRKKKIFT